MEVQDKVRPCFTARAGLLFAVLLLGLTACEVGKPVNDAPVVLEDNIPRQGDNVAATVNGTKIYQTDVERAAASQKMIESGTSLLPSDPVFGQVLEELVDQRLLAIDALRKSLDQDDEAQRRLAVARERILGNILVETHLTETVNDETIRKTYEEQKKLNGGNLEIKASHILVEDEQTAYDIAAKLANGEDFYALAVVHSEDEATRDIGGDLGFFTRDRLDSDFTKPAFATPDGEISEPFQTDFGWHIVKVHERRTAKQPELEDIRKDIVNFMTYDEIQKLLKTLRAESDIKFLHGTTQTETDEEMP